jgi:hypothetical protein
MFVLSFRMSTSSEIDRGGPIADGAEARNSRCSAFVTDRHYDAALRPPGRPKRPKSAANCVSSAAVTASDDGLEGLGPLVRFWLLGLELEIHERMTPIFS